MTNDEFTKEVNKKPHLFFWLWGAVIILFLASVVVIFGLWSSYKNDRVSNNLALSSGGESGEVLGATTEDPDYLTKLADNLKTAGVIIYGFSGDQETARQLAIFGQAAVGLDYVECNPESINANADECVARGVSQYPTWTKADKKISGFQPLEELEKLLVN